MHPGSLDVIVVGGAVGGSAAALLLARAGARVTLLERVERPRAVGAGIAIAANGMAVLESLGLTAALAGARVANAARITDAAGRTLLEPPAGTPPVALLRRSTLHGALLDALAGEPRITCRFGAELLRADREGTAVAREGERELALRADLVVGADGVRSRVRECGEFGASVRGGGIRYVRTLVDDDVGEGVEAWTGAGIFGSFAVDGGTYVFASCGTKPCRDALDARDLDALRTAWGEAYPPAGRILGAVRRFEDVLENEVIQVSCRRWHDGRLVLLGDAAHAMAPNLGQGANSALVDAAVLLDELRRATTLDDALAAYGRRRRPAVARVATASARLGRLAEVTHPLGRAVRDRVLVPVLARLASPRSVALVLQEPPSALLAIGRG